MNIVLARIDNRLIHGQVLESWVPTLKANCIIVANDEVAQTVMQKILMKAAVPRGIKVVIDTVEATAQLFKTDELDNFRVLLLFATAGDARKAIESGVPLKKLNLGNMHAGSGKLECSCTIFLDPEDVVDLQKIEASGVRISSQCVPSERSVDWAKMMINKVKD
jgi:mannose/fructose/N-acetylgalactosamine-specific phosphotransferase system component IIB